MPETDYFRHELTGEITELTASPVVIEHRTVPVGDAFAALRDRACNRGSQTLTRCWPAAAGRAPRDGAFELHRIGDAVTSRGVPGAIYDAARLCMTL